MPIFRKDERAVVFAHIPKTAGTAVYLLFLRSGWSVSNFTASRHPGSTLERLSAEFGITEIPVEGRRLGYRGTLQHAPARTWQFWPGANDSFAIVRHPVERYISALRYRHQTFYADMTWEAFLVEARQSLQGPARRVNRVYGGHFRPQANFLRRSTKVFKFEGPWIDDLCDCYDLDRSGAEKVNSSKKASITLGPEEHDWIRRKYAVDFRNLRYDPDTHSNTGPNTERATELSGKV